MSEPVAPASPRRRPTAWRLGRWFLFSVALGMGVLVGVATFTFGYAKGGSYLQNDPKGCVNCHVMKPQYDAYVKSSHGKVATCNDCHTPHDVVGKWLTKADNGYHHSLAFTTGDFPTNIQIKKKSLEVVESQCLRCHANLVGSISASRPHGEGVSCVRCHSDVGHMR